MGPRTLTPGPVREVTGVAMWFTSDWHFLHHKILGYGDGRPFDTIEEHDEALIARHNALVRPGDEVWVLGDVALGRIEDSLVLCARMNGDKTLLLGNHDRPAMTKSPAKRAAWVERYLTEGGFSRVLLAEPAITVRLPSGQLVLASHYPYRGDSRAGPDRYPERRPVDEGGWLVHGHTHSRERVNGHQIHVGVDAWGYGPVAAQQVMELIATHGQ